jgi:hypothetical protein
VLHQLPPDSQRDAAAALATLAGTRGCAFVVEVSGTAAGHFADLTRRHGPLPKLQAVFEHGIQPVRLPEELLPALLAGHGLHAAVHGHLALLSTQELPGGSFAEVPFVHWLFHRPGRAG